MKINVICPLNIECIIYESVLIIKNNKKEEWKSCEKERKDKKRNEK